MTNSTNKPTVEDFVEALPSNKECLLSYFYEKLPYYIKQKEEWEKSQEEWRKKQLQKAEEQRGR